MSLERNSILSQDIKYLKGVGPAKAELLQKELSIYTVNDLLFQYPFRYIDRTKFQYIQDIVKEGQLVQLKGSIFNVEKKSSGKRQRLVALFKDSSGIIELIWFQGIRWVEKLLDEEDEFILFGKVNIYKGKKSIPHPELEKISDSPKVLKRTFEPVYPSSEKLNARALDSKHRRKLVKSVIESITKPDIPENIPPYLLKKLNLCSRFESIQWIHFPLNEEQIIRAKARLKFEEIFYFQLLVLTSKNERTRQLRGAIFENVGQNFNTFYHEKLGFELTNAQKRVIKEIRANLGSGKHMNRLLQGDVGSGKTIVAFMIMLLALDNQFQACLMAPTEILAFQHFQSIQSMVEGLGIRLGYLTGNVKGKMRKKVFEGLLSGEIQIVIGTHALIEEKVKFKNLGLAITDEQHRFGVAQRAGLVSKNNQFPPHILVMTATPIPRTLSMTVYGDLDVSVIDELPPGRKPVKTLHKFEIHRPQVIQFMHRQIKLGRQVYVVFPLIDESEKLDLQNLQQGYENLLAFFPPPSFQVSIVHGRMKAEDKDIEMGRFVRGKTQIMVSTTVIEVGVNVPNASVMIIENAERFGLSQLHQLRGRVGRGGDQSYCVLMTSHKISKEGKERIATMCRTNNGFEIAEVDLRLRGPGDIEGTRQSGVKDFKMFDIIRDYEILTIARTIAQDILLEDPELSMPKNQVLKRFMIKLRPKHRDWGRIA